MNSGYSPRKDEIWTLCRLLQIQKSSMSYSADVSHRKEVWLMQNVITLSPLPTTGKSLSGFWGFTEHCSYMFAIVFEVKWSRIFFLSKPFQLKWQAGLESRSQSRTVVSVPSLVGKSRERDQYIRLPVAENAAGGGCLQEVNEKRQMFWSDLRCCLGCMKRLRKVRKWQDRRG